MSVGNLPNKGQERMWLAVQLISKQIPDEDLNLIKKGWDQLYMDLSRAREERPD